jgi:hypothetical protein
MWCPWCQPDPKDGTENRICSVHLRQLIQGQEMPPVMAPVIKLQYGVKCMCCGYVNPARGHKRFQKVDL